MQPLFKFKVPKTYTPPGALAELLKPPVMAPPAFPLAGTSAPLLFTVVLALSETVQIPRTLKT